MKMEQDAARLRPVLGRLVDWYLQYVSCEGGPLHIALRDGNLRDSDIWFCQEQAEKQGDNLAALIALILRVMPQTERELFYKKRTLNQVAEIAAGGGIPIEWQSSKANGKSQSLEGESTLS